MLPPAERMTRLHTLPLKVWVLAPRLVTTDANLDYYYDFTQSIAEYTRVFSELHLDWQWQPVTTSNYPEIIDTILALPFFTDAKTFCPSRLGKRKLQ